MVLCFVALIVFAILGIFSAKYRSLAGEAFNCTFRKLTLRPCESNLETRIKGKILGSALRVSPNLARVINKNFEVLSLLFTLLFFASLAYTLLGIYNFAMYGNCNGANSTGLCIYGLLAGQNQTPQVLAPNLSLLASHPALGLALAPVTVVEFGSFQCPNTQLIDPFTAFLQGAYGNRVRWIWVNADEFQGDARLANAAYCAADQGKFWAYKTLLFQRQKSEGQTDAELLQMAKDVNLDAGQFQGCLAATMHARLVQSDFLLANQSKIYGTPTFFVNGKPVLGNQPDALRAAIEDALKNSNP